MDTIKRKLTGVIVSAKSPKTAIVEVKSVKEHPKYHKRYTTVMRIPAHLEQEGFAAGDKVEMIETSPKSRTKHWLITKKV